jgi:hypothetical protein
MRPFLGWRLTATLCAVALLAGFAQAQEATEARLESTRATLAKWVETQQIISREKRD